MKAVVLEVKDGKSAILMKDGTVRKVNKAYKVGQTINISARSGSYVRYIGMVAAALVLITTGGFAYGYETVQACSYVTLDINPSIEYVMNRLDQVIGIEAINEDAVSIVDEVNDITDRKASLSEAVGNTLDVLNENGYMSEDEDVLLVDIVSDDDKRSGELRKEIDIIITGHEDDTFNVVSSGIGERNVAHERGISAGRYRMMMTQTGHDGDNTEIPDDKTLAEYKVRSVRDMLGIPQVNPDMHPDDSNPLQSEPDQPEPPQNEMPHQEQSQWESIGEEPPHQETMEQAVGLPSARSPGWIGR